SGSAAQRRTNTRPPRFLDRRRFSAQAVRCSITQTNASPIGPGQDQSGEGGSVRGKAPDGDVTVKLPGGQPGAWKGGLVRGVGKVLRLKAQAGRLPVQRAALAAQGAGEEVAGIELQPRLGGQDLHNPPRLRVAQA